MDLKHYGQIITNKKTIRLFIDDISLPVVKTSLYLLVNGVKSTEEYLKLYSICSRLYYLSRLVYKTDNGINKPKTDYYTTKLFNASAESLIEVQAIVKKIIYGPISQTQIETIYQAYLALKILWSREVSCLFEQVYIPELAYTFFYVYQHKGNNIIPQYFSDQSLFPCNYENFDYTSNIAELFSTVMKCAF